ncbi:hypothetical protein ACJA3J_02630 [Halobacillus sp. SY10]|uniref:hypothetical protein n=1 Tax=Halobacillus sp. SY10 TaxID=3381356 RepID=UPI003879BBE4
MIEISGQDISELSDLDLRALVGLLCEADLRKIGLPTAGVTWGGHHNAKDGGIDVRVDLGTSLHRDGFIPKEKTGFQVKKPDMNRSSILNEMRPKGSLREVIKELVDYKGAYIIVSSQGSTSDSALKDRRAAMVEALGEHKKTNFMVDFYDRERIAGWVRNYPSLALWIRDKIGRPIQGWRSYDNWSKSPGGVDHEYILDEHVRLHDSNVQTDLKGMSATEGINKLRYVLHKPGSSVRLVGLSGVGKTRLLQALFDERVGENSLDKAQVIYTDISDSPTPDPSNFAERLVAQKKPAILAVDNCPPNLHRRLTSICSTSGSFVSLITVEYDVREDQPEETKVFRLEPASPNLIEKIVLTRFKHISKISARSIAEFSGGNSRIAIALGNTVKQGENLSDLRDADLFNRLFHQRNETEKLLIRAAEACALVYSFDCRTEQGSNIELRLLSSIADVSIRDLYENVSELIRRDLVQQRSNWRAVLPHAIANKLAQRALENIPIDFICNVFEKGGSGRLLQSFSKRLSYLHKSKGAISISERWLDDQGLLGDVNDLDETGIKILENIAPVNPELTLSKIEKVQYTEDKTFFTRKNRNYIDITRLLRSLAYDIELFVPSAKLLILFALSERPNENVNSIRDLLKSLFYIYLSGTHATPELRLKIIMSLIETNDEEKVELGYFLLDATLESTRFTSSYDFSFGSHPRNYGYSPKNKEEVYHWFRLFIDYTVSLAVSSSPSSIKAKELLGDKFRGLWTDLGMYEELEMAAKKIHSNGPWSEGWLAVKRTISYDGEDIDEESLARLKDLDKILKPSSLINRARLYALSDSFDLINASEVQESSGDDYTKVQNISRQLGREVIEADILAELLPDLLSQHSDTLFSFGQGIADGCVNHEKVWRFILQTLSKLDESARVYQLIGGFLNGLSQSNTGILEQFLDEAVKSDILGEIYPWLQTTVEINQVGIVRLKRSLRAGKAPITQFNHIGYGRAHETISDTDFCDLLRIISLKQGGIEVALNIFYMRIYSHSPASISNDITNLGQQLILNYRFTNKGFQSTQRDNHRLAKVIEICFSVETAKEVTEDLCHKLIKSYDKYDIYTTDFNKVLKAIAKSQPTVFLQSFLETDHQLQRRIHSVLIENGGPIPNIDEAVIVDWCEEKPEDRYQALAACIVPYCKIEGCIVWTSLAEKIINNAIDPVPILNTFKTNLHPRSWSGSLAVVMEERLNLFNELKTHQDSKVRNWAILEERDFEKAINSIRKNELKQETERNERFE